MISPMCRNVLLALLTAIAGGCAFERHRLDNPGKNEVIKVESGDTWRFELEENATTGYQWRAKCDDDDVEVSIRHIGAVGKYAGAPGRAEVAIHIHRGYDGPSTVRFEYARNWEKSVAKSFTLSLYKRTGDEAFWK